MYGAWEMAYRVPESIQMEETDNHSKMQELDLEHLEDLASDWVEHEYY